MSGSPARIEIVDDFEVSINAAGALVTYDRDVPSFPKATRHLVVRRGSRLLELSGPDIAVRFSRPLTTHVISAVLAAPRIFVAEADRSGTRVCDYTVDRIETGD